VDQGDRHVGDPVEGVLNGETTVGVESCSRPYPRRTDLRRVPCRVQCGARDEGARTIAGCSL